ncbi:MAG: GGDEF domain-containing protein [Pseudobutyrivibrio sp.]|nr:GGDEF domain-containing protein [Pseudobutyrivibrio sp.]
MSLLENSIFEYKGFLKENRKRINILLNHIMWACFLTGPAIALGIFINIFPEASYMTCVYISIYMVILAIVHSFLVKKHPYSIYTSAFALVALDILLVYMTNAHIYIHITWFFVPLLSLLFCESRIFYFTVIMNYVYMVLALWMVSPYYAEVRTDYYGAHSYFLNIIGGYTIETIIMTIAGSGVGRVSERFLTHLMSNYTVIHDSIEQIDQAKEREEKLLRISNTDELTKVANRRCYYKDVEEIEAKGISDDFVIFSIDVNGLKTTNDTMGHAAGDELLKGAAECLTKAIGDNGKVYRVGGDEFFAITYTKTPEKISEDISKEVKNWHGKLIEKVSISLGYAPIWNYPNSTITDLEKKADMLMYVEKYNYYSERGIERRKAR